MHTLRNILKDAMACMFLNKSVVTFVVAQRPNLKTTKKHKLCIFKRKKSKISIIKSKIYTLMSPSTDPVTKKSSFGSSARHFTG